MRPAIVIDSTFYMDDIMLEKYDLKYVSLTVNFNNIAYREDINNPKLLDEIFGKINHDKLLPTTSQPAAQDYLNMFAKLKDEGHKKIVVFTISGKLSGTIQGALSAASMFMEENSDIEIKCFDSKNVAHGATLMLLEICRQYDKLGELTDEKIKDIIDYYSKNTMVYLIVDNLNYLSYGGRIPRSVAAIGNLFSIKPLLLVHEGEIKEFARCRSIKNAYKATLNELEKFCGEFEEDFYLTGTHAQNEKDFKKLVAASDKIAGSRSKKTNFAPFGPVVGMHVGPKAIGIGWVKKYED